MNSRLDVNEVEDLVLAKSLLEQPGLAVRLGNLIGTPLQQGFKMMPPSWAAVVHRSVRLALWGALDVAVTTLDRRRFNWARKISYKVLVGTTGGLGGAFGLAALPVELPVSTILMLRGVAEIARGEGFELDSLDTRVACLEVFAFGGPAPKNAPAESGYWLVRSAMATAVKDATTYLARRAMVEGGVPVLARLVEAIASRFGAVVSQQLAAKAVPLLGGVTGSAINVLFMDHFQKIALGHFIVKRLEQKYSRAEIREVYEGLELPRHFSVKV